MNHISYQDLQSDYSSEMAMQQLFCQNIVSSCQQEISFALQSNPALCNTIERVNTSITGLQDQIVSR